MQSIGMRQLAALTIGFSLGFLITVLFQSHRQDGSRLSQKYSLQDYLPNTHRSFHEQTKRLSRKPRVLCLIATHKQNFNTKVIEVNHTWAPRCSTYQFVTAHQPQIHIPIMKLNITESRSTLWKKTWQSMNEAAKRFDLNKFDFIMKADDDAYIVMDNLLELLATLDPNRPLLIGRRFALTGNKKKSYMSGGASYLLSRAALKLFVAKAIQTRNDHCDLSSDGPEDFLMGYCLKALGVEQVDTRDADGKERFHPLTISDMMRGVPDWMRTYSYYNLSVCPTCISPKSISFHYVSDIYEMDFMLHAMRQKDLN